MSNPLAPIFARKIPEEAISGDLKKIFELGFEDITIFHLLKNQTLHFYFSNAAWEEAYTEGNFFSLDPCVQCLFIQNIFVVPWICLPQNTPLMKTRRKICVIKEGFSFIEKIGKKEHLIVLLGSPKEDITLSLFNCRESLKNLFLIIKSMPSRF